MTRKAVWRRYTLSDIVKFICSRMLCQNCPAIRACNVVVRRVASRFTICWTFWETKRIWAAGFWSFSQKATYWLSLRLPLCLMSMPVMLVPKSPLFDYCFMGKGRQREDGNLKKWSYRKWSVDFPFSVDDVDFKCADTGRENCRGGC